MPSPPRLDEIVDVISAETCKPPMDALAGDIMVTLEHLRFYECNTARILRPRKVRRSRLFFSGTLFSELREPHGIVLIFVPWNYPLQLAVVPMATALFAGNAVLLKCSEHTQRTAQLIQQLCAAAALPPHLVQVSTEPPDQAAALICGHPDLIFFTGSNRNGRAVAAKAASLMIPTIMELGSKDPAIVLESCDLARAVNGVVYGSFSNAGQVCVGTKRIYVQQRIYDDFLRLLLARIAQLRAGASSDSDLGPILLASVRDRLHAQLADAIARGATLHTPPPTDANPSAPIVLTNVPAGASLLLDESFGPIVCITPFVAETDAIALANCCAFALAASIWTRDSAQGRRIAGQLHCGSCSINDAIRNIGNPHATFGGNKSSGYGRYHGAEGLLSFSRTKSIMSVTRPRATEVHWFPFSARTFNRLRAILQLRHTRGLRNKIKSLSSLWMLLPFLVCGVCAAAEDPPTPHGPLILDVTLPPHAHGQIAYLLFASSAGFPSGPEKAIRHDFVALNSADPVSQRIDLGPLPVGRYALSLYLDENGNRKLDKNFLGLPKEAVGVSNNPRSHMGPPRFDEAAFTHGEAADNIHISLIYCCKL